MTTAHPAKRHGLRLAEAWQVVSPSFALAEQGSAELAAILAVSGIDVVEEENLPFAYFLVPAVGHFRARLHISASLPLPVRTFIKLRAAGTLWPTRRPRSAEAVDVAALAGLFPYESFLEESDEAAAETVRALASCPSLWHGASLRTLLGLANDVLKRLYPAPPPADAAACEAACEEAYHAGRAARMDGRTKEAEGEFQRAVRLGRLVERWDIVTLSRLGIGRTHYQRGNYPKARAALERAVASARRHELHRIEGMVHHALFHLAVDRDHLAAAAEHADAARRMYEAHGDDGADLAHLAHDVGHAWVVQGDYRAALPLLLSSATTFERMEAQLVAWGDVARAAGGAGRPGLYRKALGIALNLLAKAPTEEHAAEALLGLARGARSLGFRDDAHAFARMAMEVAEKRGEARWLMEAGAVVDSLHDEPARSRQSPTPRSREGQSRRRLARGLLASLKPA
jgi:tetratricopeptide (TPR) repeat protein